MACGRSLGDHWCGPGAASFFLTVYIIRVCVPRTGFDLLASGISFTLSLSKLHFRLPVFVEKEATIGF